VVCVPVQYSNDNINVTPTTRLINCQQKIHVNVNQYKNPFGTKTRVTQEFYSQKK